MTKQELLDDLASKEFVNYVSEPELQVTELGIKIYRISFFEQVDTVGMIRSVNFYVKDEGKDTEIACYQNQEPSQSVQDNATIQEKLT